jgi:FkbH-like protein
MADGKNHRGIDMTMNEGWNHLRLMAETGSSGNVAKAAQVQREVANLLSSGTLPANVRPLRIAVLRTITIEPLIPILVSRMAAHDFAVSVELGQLGNIFAEAMQPDSFLGRGDFDVCIIVAPLETIAPEIGEMATHVDDTQSAISHFLDCVDRIGQWFTGLVLICNFAPLQPLVARRLQSQKSRSPRYVYDEANRILAARVEARRNVFLCDLAYLASRVGASEFLSARDMATVLQPFTPTGFQSLADDWAELCRLHIRGSAKCIVLDCDNTLWGGIVGEDGVHGLRLGETYPGICYQQFQRQLKQLKQVGFLLALNSKNNEADVRAVFDQHPAMVLRWEDFAATRVNWDDKAANTAALAEDLNLGVDSFVFIDDNSFELERVRAAFPGLLTLTVPAETWKLPELLPQCAALDRINLTQEDLAKAGMYAQERQRKQVQEQASSLDDYLAHLDLKMTIERFDAARHGQRAEQLLQKTNQFNLTTRRYAAKELLELDRQGAMIYVASLRDRFGDYGRIALAIVRWDDAVPEIDSFLMSCRAIGRKAETMFLHFLLQRLADRGFANVRASFVPTERNQVAASFLPDHGFQLLAAMGEEKRYERETGVPLPQAIDYYEVVRLEGAPPIVDEPAPARTLESSS